jgi:hypothetical protein
MESIEPGNQACVSPLLFVVVRGSNGTGSAEEHSDLGFGRATISPGENAKFGLDRVVLHLDNKGSDQHAVPTNVGSNELPRHPPCVGCSTPAGQTARERREVDDSLWRACSTRSGAGLPSGNYQQTEKRTP